VQENTPYNDAAQRGPSSHYGTVDAPAEIISSSKRKIRKAPLVSGIIVLVLLLVGAAALFTSSRTVCASCHRAQADVLANSTHSEATCYDCHLNGGGWGFMAFKAREWTHMYPAHRASDADAVTAPAQVSSDNCLRCHKTGDLVTGTEKSGIKINHETCIINDACTDCHARVAHGLTAGYAPGISMEQCQKCHLSDMYKKKCSLCHTQRDLDQRTGSKAWRATHGVNWRQNHGMGDLSTCSTCHASGYCVKCHDTEIPHRADFGATHGKIAQKNPRSCKVCHKAKNFCSGCHGIAMPHSDDYLQDHASIVKKQGKSVCLRCHSSEGCQDCHAKHVHPGGPQTIKKNEEAGR